MGNGCVELGHPALSSETLCEASALGLTLRPWSGGVCAAAPHSYQIGLENQLFPAGNTGEGDGAEWAPSSNPPSLPCSVENHPTGKAILFPQL